jgi:hypothetical protein
MIDLKDFRKQIARLEKDDILKLFNVEERRTAMDFLIPAAGMFGVGLIVGAGLGLLLAPRPGRELRADLRQRLTAQPEGPEGNIPSAAWVADHGARTA